ncbi:ABC transporter permease [Citricoccus sp. GCM10030269]|uniref:ABC transporter permease n=1 Tax=Citricoccus sp. GCM10030269 TaxID=3273388 RepID=UPI003620D549
MAAGLIWELYARLFPSLFIPPLSEVIEHAASSWTNLDPQATFGTNVLTMVSASLGRLLPAMGIAIAIGLVLGVAIARIRILDHLLTPVVHFVRAIPSTAKVPIFIALLGIGDVMKISVIVVAAVFPFMLNVIHGVKDIHDTTVDVCRVYRINRMDFFFRVMLPGALPQIFSGLRLMTMIALIVMVLTEMIGASDGVGYYVLYAERRFLVLDMWAGVLLLGAIGYLLSVILNLLERPLLRWHTAQNS